MIETTTHCDYCGNPLGSKCDRYIGAALRARDRGIIVGCRFVSPGIRYEFFCSTECEQKSHGEKLHGQEKIHKTQDEKKEGTS